MYKKSFLNYNNKLGFINLEEEVNCRVTVRRMERYLLNIIIYIYAGSTGELTDESRARKYSRM